MKEGKGPDDSSDYHVTLSSQSIPSLTFSFLRMGPCQTHPSRTCMYVYMQASIYLHIYHIPLYYVYLSSLCVHICLYITVFFFLSPPSPASLTSFCLSRVFFFFVCLDNYVLRSPLQRGWSSLQSPSWAP